MMDFSCFWSSCTVATSSGKLSSDCIIFVKLWSASVSSRPPWILISFPEPSFSLTSQGNLVLRVFDPGNGNEVGRRVKKLRN